MFRTTAFVAQISRKPVQVVVRLDDGHELKQEGIGLGLYVTEQLVTLQGDTVAVESEFGEESRFIPRFPRNAPGF